jgi:hypothetical protein
MRGGVRGQREGQRSALHVAQTRGSLDYVLHEAAAPPSGCRQPPSRGPLRLLDADRQLPPTNAGNVLFEDSHTVKRAIVGLGQPLLSDQAAPDGSSWQGVHPRHVSSSFGSLLYLRGGALGWHGPHVAGTQAIALGCRAVPALRTHPSSSTSKHPDMLQRIS